MPLQVNHGLPSLGKEYTPDIKSGGPKGSATFGSRLLNFRRPGLFLECQEFDFRNNANFSRRNCSRAWVSTFSVHKTDRGIFIYFLLLLFFNSCFYVWHKVSCSSFQFEVTENDLNFLVFPTPLPKGWDYRCIAPHLSLCRASSIRGMNSTNSITSPAFVWFQFLVPRLCMAQKMSVSWVNVSFFYKSLKQNWNWESRSQCIFSEVLSTVLSFILILVGMPLNLKITNKFWHSVWEFGTLWLITPLRCISHMNSPISTLRVWLPLESMLAGFHLLENQEGTQFM